MTEGVASRISEMPLSSFTIELLIIGEKRFTWELECNGSVSSGLARAIIHNSDYQSAEECKAAIDRYFHERNEHFNMHAKRAGNRILGQRKG
jgi:hypothetical protein